MSVGGSFLSSFSDSSLLETDHATVCRSVWLLVRIDAVGGVLGGCFFVRSVLESTSERRDVRLARPTALFGGRVISHKVSTDRGRRRGQAAGQDDAMLVEASGVVE